jgi:hypothetical protein
MLINEVAFLPTTAQLNNKTGRRGLPDLRTSVTDAHQRISLDLLLCAVVQSPQSPRNGASSLPLLILESIVLL